MKLSDIRAKLARPQHDCQVKGRQTGRHRGEPKHRWGLPLFFLGTTGTLFAMIITAFIVMNNPVPAVSVQPSYNPTPAPHVFPPVRQQPSPAASTYTVVAGDTMWSIAYKKCGNGLAWEKLQHENSNNPWRITPGQVLTVAC